jgi:glycogen synthase
VPARHDALPIAVACAGDPTDPGAYSGAPASVLRGLAEAGRETWAIRARVPQRLSERRQAAGTIYGRPVRAMRTGAAALDLARAPRLGGCVQYGCEYRLLTHAPVVTLEDQTMAEARRRAAHWPWLRNVPARHIDDFVAWQGAIYRRARACCFMSHWAAASMMGEYEVEPEKVHVVGVGRNQEPLAGARDWERPTFLFVGADWERKNGPRVVRAFEVVREAVPEAVLHVVGGHPAIDRPGVVEHGRLSLRRPDERAEAAALFAAATCLVIPSEIEPSGIVFAEALAAGIPSIYTTAGGSATIVGEAGIGVDPGDERALVDAMTALAEPERARALGTAALGRASLFTWRAVAERLLRALAPAGADVSGLAAFL